MLTRFILPALALGALLLAASGAMAHETTDTSDGMYFITTGQQGEPVYTFQATNLDLIVRLNESGERGANVGGVHANVTATLIGPGGEELTGTLTTQFGQEGRYEFENGYALTRPGIYQLRLEGMIGETDVTGLYDMPGPIQDQSEVMFPDQGLPTLRELDDLQERVEELEAQVAQRDEEAPGPAAILVVGLVAVAAAFLRSRSRR